MLTFTSFLIMASLTCPEANIVNNTKTWNKDDQQTLQKAQRRCGELYEDAPCLITFTKKDDLAYTVICGAKR